MKMPRKKSYSQLSQRRCEKVAEDAGTAATLTGLGLIASIFGNVLQARNERLLQTQVHLIWEERDKFLAALRDWQAAYSRMEVSLRFTEASLRFLDEQNHQLREQLAEVQRQRDKALIDNQELRRANANLHDQTIQHRKD